MSKEKTVYVIAPKEESGITMKPRLVRGDRRSAVEGHLLDCFSIEKPTVEQVLELGADGVQIEDVAV